MMAGRLRYYKTCGLDFFRKRRKFFILFAECVYNGMSTENRFEKRVLPTVSNFESAYVSDSSSGR